VGAAELIANNQLPNPQYLNVRLLSHSEKNYLTLAVGVNASKPIGAPRRKLLHRCRFSFVLWLNNKIMSVGRQIFDIAGILNWCVQIKKHRLIIWIYRIKRLIRRN